MRDGVTPVCLVCGEPLELEVYMERLDSNQPFIDWCMELGHDFRTTSICGPCRENPERLEMLEDLTSEQVRRRLRGEF